MGCTQPKPKKQHSQSNNMHTNNNTYQCDNTTINNQKYDHSSQAEVSRATVPKFPERALIPNLEHKQVVILQDHFLKKTVQVPVLQSVEQSSLMAHRTSIHKMRTGSLSPKTTPEQPSQFAIQNENIMNNRIIKVA